MSITETLLTADDLWRMPVSAMRRELVRGELIETLPPGVQHGIIALALGVYLRLWAQSSQASYVGVEAGFRLDHDPDTVRGPDVFFISGERVAGSDIPVGFGEFAPDLAVEVVSPNETAEARREKVDDYLQAGSRLVWEIYPRRREVVAHTPDGRAQTFRSTDTLAAPDVLPGFTCPVAALFE